MFSWYKYLIVSFFPHLGFWSGNLFLIAPFPDRCLLVPFQDSDTGFPIRYPFDGIIFNHRMLQAKIKVQTGVLDELLYTGDMLKNASSEAKMQRAMYQVSQSCDNYDLTISTKKTEVVHQPAPRKPYNEPTITVNGQN